MRLRRIAVITAVGLTAAGGTGAAIAAGVGDDGKKAEDAVLRDAAQDLDVSPGRLREALKDATTAQLERELERAVKAGELTREQADEIRKRRSESDRVLGIGPGPGPGFGHGPRHHGGFRGAPGGGPLEHVAKALGINRAKLFSELRDGKTIAQVAKARGKSLDEVKKDAVASAKAQLDKDVKDGDLTQSQAKSMLEHFEEHIDRLGSGRPFGPPHGPGGPGGPGGPPPPGGMLR